QSYMKKAVNENNEKGTRKKKFDIEGKSIKWLVSINVSDFSFPIINVRAQKSTKKSTDETEKYITVDEFDVECHVYNFNYVDVDCKLLKDDDLIFSTEEYLQILSFSDKNSKIISKYIGRRDNFFLL